MATLKTVNISGKEYVTVNERLKFFRQEYPKYSLRSEITLDGDTVLVKAVIRDESDRILAEGTAYETKGSSFINKTSHVENAETSAWGRALGNLGIGIDASVATADEVANAVLNQNKPVLKREDSNKCSTGDVVAITGLCKETGSDLDKLYDWAGVVNKVPTKEQAKLMIDALKKKLSSQLDSK